MSNDKLLSEKIDYQWYDLYSHMSSIILVMLTDFLYKHKEEGMGYDGRVSGLDEWREIISEMRYAFMDTDTLVDDILGENFHLDEELANEYSDVLDYVVERQEKALQLFVKYYYSLWD